MSRNLSFFVEGWALGLTAYALVFTREVPTVFAQAPVETDCSTPLDQPDTTYLLNANVASDCIIAADNIILDGQSLYEIAGSVRSNTSATFRSEKYRCNSRNTQDSTRTTTHDK